jgi:hypothetical protein
MKCIRVILSGLSPNNEKTKKNPQSSGKIFRLLKIPQIFRIVFLSKIPRKTLQKSCQLAEPKNLPGKFSYFQEKFIDIKFSEFVRKIFRTQIFITGLSLDGEKNRLNNFLTNSSLPLL